MVNGIDQALFERPPIGIAFEPDGEGLVRTIFGLAVPPEASATISIAAWCQSSGSSSNFSSLASMYSMALMNEPALAAFENSVVRRRVRNFRLAGMRHRPRIAIGSHDRGSGCVPSERDPRLQRSDCFTRKNSAHYRPA
jgi:hypothetical protein